MLLTAIQALLAIKLAVKPNLC